MSDEESFVILGSSPMSSLEVDGGDTKNNLRTSSLQSDTPGSRFSSLKSSQMSDLQNAQEIVTQARDENLIQPERSNPVISSFIKSRKSSASYIKDNDESDVREFHDCRNIQPETAVSAMGIQPKTQDIEWAVAQMAEPTLIKSKTDFVHRKLDDPVFRSMIKTAVEKDISGSHLSYLKKSQIIDSRSDIQPEMADPGIKIAKPNLIQPEMADPTIIIQRKSQDRQQQLWSREPQVQVEENMMPFNLEDCALKSPLEQKQEQQLEKNVIQATTINSTNGISSFVEITNNKSTSSSNKSTPPLSVDNNLASSFLMGEVNADVLKTSVYSQFPSISMEACAEDVVKLQNMVTEYSQLKTTIKKANNTMKQFYNNSLQWKEKMKTMEEKYKNRLDGCQREIEVLRKQNQELESSFKSQIEALEIARKKDREETVQEISEKNALVENMRAQIIKLEQQQMASFEFVAQTQGEQKTEQFNQVFITRREHNDKIKQLERKLSEMLASNLDFKDIETQYVDELNCLKVNLVASEELHKKYRAEIAELVEANRKGQQQMVELEKSIEELTRANEQQCERISLLEHQNEVHRKDFEMEQESRQTAVKEKQQILQDLRNLQRKNQELIEEHQKIAQSYQKKYSSAEAMQTSQITAAAAAAQTYLNNPQRPIRALPSPSTAQRVALHMCPICNKAFNSLNILESHVQDCLDKN
ncbi:NF-kappa-B essential modulator isoform X2 [Calliphora vicina]|uniref:NF-kappa-B essential modulator isoform X2 n=1 Tax=Calliphora vicina TaxID=7373 RepID=UPI00325AF825